MTPGSSVRPVTTAGQCWLPGGSTLEFLLGRWRASRVVTDFRSGQAGTFTGLAVFAGHPEFPAGAAACRPGPHGALRYHEQGELRFGGHQGPASRTLLYLPGPAGSARVLFADGRPFYRLDLRSGSCTAEHPCGDDSYLVTVRVLGQDGFTERWRATGPGKDYEMITSFARTGAAA